MSESLLDMFEEVIDDEEQFSVLKKIEDGKSEKEIIESFIGAR